jgi:hypothetical protein
MRPHPLATAPTTSGDGLVLDPACEQVVDARPARPSGRWSALVWPPPVWTVTSAEPTSGASSRAWQAWLMSTCRWRGRGWR